MSEHPIDRNAVLVVDDQPMIVEVLCEMVRLTGARAHGCTNGVTALDLLETFHKEICLVISDVMMPGMDGRVLAGRVRSLYPYLPILLISGYSDDEPLP